MRRLIEVGECFQKENLEDCEERQYIRQAESWLMLRGSTIETSNLIAANSIASCQIGFIDRACVNSIVPRRFEVS